MHMHMDKGRCSFRLLAVFMELAGLPVPGSHLASSQLPVFSVRACFRKGVFFARVQQLNLGSSRTQLLALHLTWVVQKLTGKGN